MPQGNTECAVYYSINNSPRYLELTKVSLNSLRVYNRNIPVYLFIYGDMAALDLGFLKSLNVNLVNQAEVSPDFFTSLKWFSLQELSKLELNRLMFVDADTVFFQDAEILLKQCSELDFYARQEAGLDKSHSSYSIGSVTILNSINSQIRDFLIKAYKVKDIPFFNTGVMVFNNRFFAKIIGQLDFYNQVLNNFVTKKTPYPSSNQHILEEIVVNIMLGKFSDFTYGFLDKNISPYYLEFRENEVKHPGVVMHIWGHYYPEFITKFCR